MYCVCFVKMLLYGQERYVMTMVEKLAAALQKHNLISVELVPWFLYGLNRMLLSVLTHFVLFLLGWLICGFASTTTFLVGFNLLRRSIGGWHAKTPITCLCCSVLQITFVLGVLYPLFMSILYLAIVGTLVSSAICIVLLAPMPPEKLHVTPQELTAMRHMARKTLSAEMVVVFFFLAFGLTALALSTSLGIGCAAFSLWIANIKKK